MRIDRVSLVLGFFLLYACSGSNDSPSTATAAPANLNGNVTKLVKAELDPQKAMVPEPPLSGQLPRDLMPPI